VFPHRGVPFDSLSLGLRSASALAITVFHVFAHSLQVSIGPEPHRHTTHFLDRRDVELPIPDPPVKCIPADLEFLGYLSRGVSSHNLNKKRVRDLMWEAKRRAS
jgi:hypothetical protein